jgi:Zn-dependent protease
VRLLDVVVLLAVAIPSVILHEVSHGWAALRLGDDTAKRKGRLTLNPFAHVDPVGTILLPAVLAASGLGVIGYAKPVPVNVRRLRKPRDHAVLVALAGPATNIVLALAAAVLVRLLGGIDQPDVGDIRWDAPMVLSIFGITNVLLALFNLLPIPPLDGSAVVERAIPNRWLGRWYQVRKYSMFVLLGLFLFAGVGDLIVDPAFEVWEVLAG